MNLNVSPLEDIDDDMDFCMKLSKEESVLILPGKIDTKNLSLFEVG